MNLDYKALKNTYINLFENSEKCDFILTDVLFAFNELYPIINNSKIKNVLEIGSGTGILLKELSNIFENKTFYGLDPHKRGFDSYEKISKKISNKNLKIFHDDFEKFNPKEGFDLIFSFNVFEHLVDQLSYINKTYEFLNEDGKSVILCPNYDFPYQPHFVIPIIINKKFTYKIFKKKIIKHEAKTNEPGLWKGLNFCSKKKIKNYLGKNNFDHQFDLTIAKRFLDRIDNDESSYFQKRQGIVAKIARIAKKINLDKLIFDFFKIPFPYMKIIIRKRLK